MLYILVVVALVFKIELPVDQLQSVTRFASFNSEDVAILLLGLVVCIEILDGERRRFRMTLPRLTWVIFIMNSWILVSVLIAGVQSAEPVTASLLWTLKTLEVFVFFVLIQQHMNRDLARLVVTTIVASGILISAVVLALALVGVDRPSVFFGNPNGLSVFLLLVAFIPLSRLYLSMSLRSVVLNGTLAIVPILAVVSTVSRAALFGLVSGTIALTVLLLPKLSFQKLLALGGVSVGSIAALPLLIGTGGIRRFTEWITIKNGRIMLADNAIAHSFQTRLDLLTYGIDLFVQNPVFGMGWYASPSRITFLDNYYITILVELGLIGSVLFALYHVLTFKVITLARSQRAMVLGSAVFAWQVGILVQAIGGPFPRVPHQMMLLLLVLVSLWELGRHEDDTPQSDRPRTSSISRPNSTDN